MPKVALKLENTAINSDNPYIQMLKRQTTQLQAIALSTKQKYSGKKTHSVVFGTTGNILLEYIKPVGLAPVNRVS